MSGFPCAWIFRFRKFFVGSFSPSHYLQNVRALAMGKYVRMQELFEIPKERGRHRLSLREGNVVVFESIDGTEHRAEVHLGVLRNAYDTLYKDGSFREALFYSLSHACLPLSLNVEHHSIAQQLRENHVYGNNRTLDD